MMTIGGDRGRGQNLVIGLVGLIVRVVTTHRMIVIVIAIEIETVIIGRMPMGAEKDAVRDPDLEVESASRVAGATGEIVMIVVVMVDPTDLGVNFRKVFFWRVAFFSGVDKCCVRKH